MVKHNRRKGSEKNSGSRKNRDYTELPLYEDIDGMMTAHNVSIEDLAFLGLCVWNGAVAEPLRHTAVGDTPSTMLEMAESGGMVLDDAAKAVLSKLSQDEVSRVAKDIDGKTFDVDFEEWLIMPTLLKQRKPGRYVITTNRALQQKGIQQGIIVWRNHPFEWSRKRVTKELYVAIRKMCNVVRRRNRTEEKNGIR